MKVKLEIDFDDRNVATSYEWEVVADMAVESSAGQTLVMRSKQASVGASKDEMISALFDLCNQLNAARSSMENF